MGAALAAITRQPGEIESRLKAAPTEHGYKRIVYIRSLSNCKMRDQTRYYGAEIYNGLVELSAQISNHTQPEEVHETAIC